MQKLFLILLFCLILGGCQNQVQPLTETTQKESDKPKETPKETPKFMDESDSEEYIKKQEKKRIYTEGNFKYHYRNDERGIWITEIIPTSNEKIDTLIIPSEIEGQAVTRLGGVNDSVEGEDDGTSIFGTRYKRVEKIKKIFIPDTVRVITYNCLNGLPDGKSIRMPGNMDDDDYIYNMSTAIQWKNFDISETICSYSSKNGLLLSSDGGMLYGLINLQSKKRL